MSSVVVHLEKCFGAELSLNCHVPTDTMEVRGISEFFGVKLEGEFFFLTSKTKPTKEF